MDYHKRESDKASIAKENLCPSETPLSPSTSNMSSKLGPQKSRRPIIGSIALNSPSNQHLKRSPFKGSTPDSLKTKSKQRFPLHDRNDDAVNISRSDIESEFDSSGCEYNRRETADPAFLDAMLRDLNSSKESEESIASFQSKSNKVAVEDKSSLTSLSASPIFSVQSDNISVGNTGFNRRRETADPADLSALLRAVESEEEGTLPKPKSDTCLTRATGSKSVNFNDGRRRETIDTADMEALLADLDEDQSVGSERSKATGNIDSTSSQLDTNNIQHQNTDISPISSSYPSPEMHRPYSAEKTFSPVIQASRALHSPVAKDAGNRRETAEFNISLSDIDSSIDDLGSKHSSRRRTANRRETADSIQIQHLLDYLDEQAEGDRPSQQRHTQPCSSSNDINLGSVAKATTSARPSVSFTPERQVGSAGSRNSTDTVNLVRSVADFLEDLAASGSKSAEITTPSRKVSSNQSNTEFATVTTVHSSLSVVSAVAAIRRSCGGSTSQSPTKFAPTPHNVVMGVDMEDSVSTSADISLDWLGNKMLTSTACGGGSEDGKSGVSSHSCQSSRSSKSSRSRSKLTAASPVGSSQSLRRSRRLTGESPGSGQDTASFSGLGSMSFQSDPTEVVASPGDDGSLKDSKVKLVMTDIEFAEGLSDDDAGQKVSAADTSVASIASVTSVASEQAPGPAQHPVMLAPLWRGQPSAADQLRREQAIAAEPAAAPTAVAPVARKSCIRSTIPLPLHPSSNAALSTKKGAKSVVFGSPKAAEFHSTSPSTKLTPMHHKEAKQLFPFELHETQAGDEDEDAETAENSRILDEFERLTNSNDRVSSGRRASFGSSSPRSRRRRKSTLHGTLGADVESDVSDIVMSPATNTNDAADISFVASAHEECQRGDKVKSVAFQNDSVVSDMSATATLPATLLDIIVETEASARGCVGAVGVANSSRASTKAKRISTPSPRKPLRRKNTPKPLLKQPHEDLNVSAFSDGCDVSLDKRRETADSFDIQEMLNMTLDTAVEDDGKKAQPVEDVSVSSRGGGGDMTEELETDLRSLMVSTIGRRGSSFSVGPFSCIVDGDDLDCSKSSAGASEHSLGLLTGRPSLELPGGGADMDLLDGNSSQSSYAPLRGSNDDGAAGSSLADSFKSEAESERSYSFLAHNEKSASAVEELPLLLGVGGLSSAAAATATAASVVVAPVEVQRAAAAVATAAVASVDVSMEGGSFSLAGETVELEPGLVALMSRIEQPHKGIERLDSAEAARVAPASSSLTANQAHAADNMSMTNRSMDDRTATLEIDLVSLMAGLQDGKTDGKGAHSKHDTVNVSSVSDGSEGRGKSECMSGSMGGSLDTARDQKMSFDNSCLSDASTESCDKEEVVDRLGPLQPALIHARPRADGAPTVLAGHNANGSVASMVTTITAAVTESQNAGGTLDDCNVSILGECEGGLGVSVGSKPNPVLQRLRGLNADARQNSLAQCSTPLGHSRRMSNGMKRHSLGVIAAGSAAALKRQRPAYEVAVNPADESFSIASSLSPMHVNEGKLGQTAAVIAEGIPKKAHQSVTELPRSDVSNPGKAPTEAVVGKVYSLKEALSLLPLAMPQKTELGVGGLIDSLQAAISSYPDHIRSAVSFSFNELLGASSGECGESIQRLEKKMAMLWSKVPVEVHRVLAKSEGTDEAARAFIRAVATNAVLHAQTVWCEWESHLAGLMRESIISKLEKGKQGFAAAKLPSQEQSQSSTAVGAAQIEALKARIAAKKREIDEKHEQLIAQADEIASQHELRKEKVVARITALEAPAASISSATSSTAAFTAPLDDPSKKIGVTSAPFAGPAVEKLKQPASMSSQSAITPISQELDRQAQRLEILNRLTYCRLLVYEASCITVEVLLTARVSAKLEFKFAFDGTTGTLKVEHLAVDLETRSAFPGQPLSNACRLAIAYFALVMCGDDFSGPLSERVLSTVLKSSDIPAVLHKVTSYVAYLRHHLAALNRHFSGEDLATKHAWAWEVNEQGLLFVTCSEVAVGAPTAATATLLGMVTEIGSPGSSVQLNIPLQVLLSGQVVSLPSGFIGSKKGSQIEALSVAEEAVRKITSVGGPVAFPFDSVKTVVSTFL